MNRKLFILSLMGLLLPSLVLGAVFYLRTPSGYTISNPVSFDVSFDTFEDFGFTYQIELINYWSLWAHPIGIGEFYYGCYPTSTLSIYEAITFPINSYYSVAPSGFSDDICSDGIDDGIYLEGGGGELIFEVVEEEAPISLFSITPDDITSLWGFASGLFSDAKLLVLLAIGVPLAFFVIKKVLRLTPKGK